MSEAKKSAYDLITEQILSLLDKGIIPWRKTWSPGNFEGAGGQMNLTTKKEYRGINQILLSCMGFNSPYWVTFNQCKKLGGKIIKGSKSTPVVFWKFIQKKQTAEEKIAGTKPEQVPMLRYYRVFNTDQCEGLKVPEFSTTDSEPTVNRIENAENIVSDMPNPPNITHTNIYKAYFRPSTDTVNVPPIHIFETPESYYSTMFHELAHSTGHRDRLARPSLGIASFGSHNYAKEELIAEMTATMLCNVAGIANEAIIENSAAYIQSWKTKITKDNRLVVLAAGKAQKAADYILNK